MVAFLAAAACPSVFASENTERQKEYINWTLANLNEGMRGLMPLYAKEENSAKRTDNLLNYYRATEHKTCLAQRIIRNFHIEILLRANDRHIRKLNNARRTTQKQFCTFLENYIGNSANVNLGIKIEHAKELYDKKTAGNGCGNRSYIRKSIDNAVSRIYCKQSKSAEKNKSLEDGILVAEQFSPDLTETLQRNFAPFYKFEPQELENPRLSEIVRDDNFKVIHA